MADIEQTRPSYEDGKVRDPRIEAMQEEGFNRVNFQEIARKAAKQTGVASNEGQARSVQTSTANKHLKARQGNASERT